MRTAEINTITRAIQSYAVMLNRPQWLDEHRFDVQVDVWTRVISNDPRAGLLDLDDIEAALAVMLQPSGSRAIDVMPTPVIEAAMKAAHRRQLIADQLLNQLDHHPEMFMYQARVEITETPPDDRDDLYDELTGRAIGAVLRSALDHDDIERLVVAIGTLSADEQLRLT